MAEGPSLKKSRIPAPTTAAPIAGTKGWGDMSEIEKTTGSETIKVVSRERTIVLVQSLLVDWKVFEHLRDHGVVEERFALRAQAGCCKPDGGTCCVNKQG
jgi:hypothetical protein